LAERLQRRRRPTPDTEVQLRADEAVPYGRVVEVMGAAQKAGLQPHRLCCRARCGALKAASPPATRVRRAGRAP
jgi:biopolymer transport protein TolR